MISFKNTVFLSLGSNLGDKRANLNKAIEFIGQLEETILGKYSSVYRTKAWGNTDQPDFYNQVISIQTNLDPELLMDALLNVEERLGRIRAEKWGPRTIDIDILMYEDQMSNSEKVIVPHPQLENRKFILTPFAEIAPELIHPVLNKSIAQLLTECTDQLEVEKVGNEQ